MCHDACMKETFDPRNCKQCSQPFVPKRRWQDFCSNDCRKKSYFSDRVVVKQSYIDELKRKAGL